MESALNEILDSTATPTDLFGEFWNRWGDGRVSPVNDVPHTWEAALFDMSALCIYGAAPGPLIAVSAPHRRQRP